MLRIMGPGGDLSWGRAVHCPRKTPLENVQTLMECARHEGVYRADGQLQ